MYLLRDKNFLLLSVWCLSVQIAIGSSVETGFKFNSIATDFTIKSSHTFHGSKVKLVALLNRLRHSSTGHSDFLDSHVVNEFQTAESDNLALEFAYTDKVQGRLEHSLEQGLVCRFNCTSCSPSESDTDYTGTLNPDLYERLSVADITNIVLRDAAGQSVSLGHVSAYQRFFSCLRRMMISNDNDIIQLRPDLKIDNMCIDRLRVQNSAHDNNSHLKVAYLVAASDMMLQLLRSESCTYRATFNDGTEVMLLGDAVSDASLRYNDKTKRMESCCEGPYRRQWIGGFFERK